MANGDPLIFGYLTDTGFIPPSKVPLFEAHAFMDHSDKFPLFSRDWEDIDCSAVACLNNRNNKCTVSSLAVIGEDGRCKGFTVISKKEETEIKIDNPISTLEIE